MQLQTLMKQSDLTHHMHLPMCKEDVSFVI